jgi:hypothetical protein
MKDWMAPGVLALLAAASVMAAQPAGTRTLSGTVTIATRNATTAVLGQTADGPFMFCVDQDRSAPQAIDYKGKARVIYRPAPQPELPPGVTISGPEPVEAALAVVAEDGRAWRFVRSGKPQIDDASLAKATTVAVRTVQRTDWAPANGVRRGIDLQGCLAPGGD